MKRCMNPKCGDCTEEGVEVTITHRSTATGERITTELWACCSDCALAAQFEHADKSAIYGTVIADQELGLLCVPMKSAGGMVS
jgi:thiamine biosynthesis lipoprotein ApbE